MRYILQVFEDEGNGTKGKVTFNNFLTVFQIQF